MPAGLGPKGSERECIPDLSLASSGLQAIFGIPWLEDASPRSLSSSLLGIFPVCMSLRPKVILYKGPP